MFIGADLRSRYVFSTQNKIIGKAPAGEGSPACAPTHPGPPAASATSRGQHALLGRAGSRRPQPAGRRRRLAVLAPARSSITLSTRLQGNLLPLVRSGALTLCDGGRARARALPARGLAAEEEGRQEEEEEEARGRRAPSRPRGLPMGFRQRGDDGDRGALPAPARTSTPGPASAGTAPRGARPGDSRERRPGPQTSASARGPGMLGGRRGQRGEPGGRKWKRGGERV